MYVFISNCVVIAVSSASPPAPPLCVRLPVCILALFWFQLSVYTKAPYFISPGSCTLTSSTSKTRVPPSTLRGGTNFSRPLPRQAVLERHGGLER